MEVTRTGRGLKNQAYLEIRNRILEGGFRPGEQLPESSLTVNLGFSRTPVREALQLLATEGLVTLVPQRGAFVTEISVSDVWEIFQMREVLEGLAARLSAHNVPTSSLLEYKQKFKDVDEMGDEKEILRVGDEFDSWIVSSCGNARLISNIENMLTSIRQVQSVAKRVPGRILKSLHEHQHILEACCDRDEFEAEKRMREHIISTRDSTMSALSQLPVK